MRRHYSAAQVAETADGFAVTLDGKPLRTPGGRALAVGHHPLAVAVAGEWLAQGDTILPETMPLTQLTATMIDRVVPARAAVSDRVVAYAQSDLLCYRASEPDDLVERQQRVWQPLFDWAAARMGVHLAVTRGVMPISQPAAAVTGLRRVIDTYDAVRLTVLQSVVAATGSLLLGLAVVEGRLRAGEAFAASAVDETFQSELWGEDSEASRRRNVLRRDVEAAARFLALCAPQPLSPTR
jgi:chaperone required for assembly of F1-ATPase